MAELGLYTTSGILYEGCDFPAWHKRIEAVLKLHLHVERTEHLYYLWGDSELESAAAKVRAFMSDHLLQRVPQELHERPMSLLRAVEAYARPFRLMDLPTELRVPIYEESIMQGTRSYDISWQHDEADRGNHASIPALLHSSSVVRREALPLFFSLTRFYLTIDFTASDGHNGSMPEGLKKLELWATTVAAEHRGSLRHIWLFIEDFDDSFDINLHFSETKGLWFEIMDKSTPLEFQEKVKRLIAATEAYRQALDLKGEALILAAICKPKLWSEIFSMKDNI